MTCRIVCVVLLSVLIMQTECLRVKQRLKHRQSPSGLRMLTKFLTEDNSKLKDQGAVFDETGMDGLENEQLEEGRVNRLKQKAKSAAILFMRQSNKEDLQAYGVDSDYELQDNQDWKSFMVLMMNNKGDHELVKVCVQTKDNNEEGGQIAFVIHQNDYCRSRFSLVEQNKYERAQMTMTTKQKQKLFDQVINTSPAQLQEGQVINQFISQVAQENKKNTNKSLNNNKNKNNITNSNTNSKTNTNSNSNSDQYNLIKKQMEALQKQLENMKNGNNSTAAPKSVQNEPVAAAPVKKVEQVRFTQESKVEATSTFNEQKIQSLIKDNQIQQQKYIQDKIDEQNKSFKQQLDIMQRQIDNLYSKIQK